MATMETALEICALKAKARRLYMHVKRRSSELDCGAHIADMIRPDIGEAEREFETVMARLREIDPTTPLRGQS